MSQAHATRYHPLHDVIYDYPFDSGNYVVNTPTTPSTLLGSHPITPPYNDHFKRHSSAMNPGALSRPRRKHPFSSSFEPPRWKTIACHVLVCLIAFSLVIAAARVANRIPLFWSRFIVGLSCGIAGFFTGYSILNLARLHLEAATWATVIHRSRTRDSSGVKLRDLAAITADSASAWTALCLLWNRARYTETTPLTRNPHHHRLWTLVVLLFLVLFVIATSSPFILGRLVRIEATTINQTKNYDEVAIAGMNSDAEIQRAAELSSAFDDFALTWTMASFSAHGELPSVVSFEHENDIIYFSETILSQLVPSGRGLGTFLFNTRNSSLDGNRSKAIATDNIGSILRFPRWGTRLHCAKIPDTEQNIVARSQLGFTYVYTPKLVLQDLFSSFNMEYPTIEPFNASNVLQLNDTLPTSINSDEMAFGGEGFLLRNSVNQIIKDNGRDSYYVPSPTVVSFSNGTGPLGYTELSAEHFARARGLADASNVLPYFVGSGRILARRYYDNLLTSASVNAIHLGIYFSSILAIGLITKLPLDLPHRGFEVYSWIAAFHADELIGIGSNTGITKNMDLDEIAERVGSDRFRFTINQ